ncbi:MAG: hypothetical protein ACE5GZ_04765 [Gammaproteobacteria bacterium]
MSVSPVRQTHWDWRAVGNWVGGGTGSGIMILAALLALMGIDSYFTVLLSCVFIMAGLFSVLMKIGRPLRALYVFRNPFTSWMAREAYVAVLLLPSGLAAFWFHSPALLLLSALFAFGYLYCQAYILKDCRGIPAWRIDEVVPLIITMALVEGAGIILLSGPFIPPLQRYFLSPEIQLSSLAKEISSPDLLVTAWILLVARVITWQRYYSALKENSPVATIEQLRQVNRPYLMFGNLLPVLLLFTPWLLNEFITVPLVVAGLCMLLSGWWVKFIIVARAGYDQGFALPHSPARGAGKPGPGVKPGWPENNNF